jgi:glycosyltransferase involved in cell wall biosynthesis
MISVVMPYWRRQSILKKNLNRYADFYDNIEVIVVDDGSPEPAQSDHKFVRIIRLPAKDHALNPCVCFNRGVAEARGDTIVLTNPEVLHREPILQRMKARLDGLGRAYVAAACWGGSWWYCHSTSEPPDMKVGRARRPEGAGFHFCSMLPRSLYEEVGGFSEEYRNGQGYEDNDFLWRLWMAKTQFEIMDDCVTEHIACLPSKWHGGSNKELFERKWANV